MYYRDHGPAHFHAVYGDFEITVEIESGRITMAIFRNGGWLTCWNGKNCIVSNCWRLGRLLELAANCRVLIRWSEIHATAHH